MYKCDICSNALSNKQAGTTYPRYKILSSPGYWEKFLKNSTDPVFAEIFNDDSTAMAVQMIITTHTDFTICAACNSMLSNDRQKVTDYRLEKWHNILQSPLAKGKEGLEATLITIGTVYERLSGKWPSWISADDKSTRDKEWNKSAKKKSPRDKQIEKKWWQFWS